MAKKYYESIERKVDHLSGEVIESKSIVKRRVEANKFIKVYLEDLSAVLGLTSQTEFKVLYKLWELSEWGTNEVLIYKEVKEKMGEEVGKSSSGISNSIASLTKKGLLKNVARMKYILNPLLFFKGDDIQKGKVLKVYLEYQIVDSEE